MSRLDTLMPYDHDHKAVNEFAFLFGELKRSFSLGFPVQGLVG